MRVWEDVFVKFDPVFAVAVVLWGDLACVVDALRDGNGHGC